MTQFYQDNGGAAALAAAIKRFNGTWYQFGGNPDLGDTDCSGLAMWAYEQVGVYLPRITEGQYLKNPIPRSWLSMPGDLLFIPGDPVDANPGHVMIYVRDGVVFQDEQTGSRAGMYFFNTASFEYRTRPALALPVRPKPTFPTPKGFPNGVELAQQHLVGVPNVKAAELAMRNGWTLWYYVEGHKPSPFCPQIGGGPKGVALFANKDYRNKK